MISSSAAVRARLMFIAPRDNGDERISTKISREYGPYSGTGNHAITEDRGYIGGAAEKGKAFPDDDRSGCHAPGALVATCVALPIPLTPRRDVVSMPPSHDWHQGTYHP